MLVTSSPKINLFIIITKNSLFWDTFIKVWWLYTVVEIIFVLSGTKSYWVNSHQFWVVSFCLFCITQKKITSVVVKLIV